MASIIAPLFKLRLMKTSKLAKELVILFHSFFLYVLEVNSRIPPIQAETVLTTPNDTLIGKPTTVNEVLIIEILLITPTELAPVDACSNLL